MSDALEDSLLARLTTEIRSLWGFLWMLTGDRTQADDLVQETCFEAWRQRSDRWPSGDLGPWLRGIARNVARRHRRRASQTRSATFEPEVMERLAVVWAEDPTSGSDRLEALRICLEGLSAEHRTVLDRRYGEDWSHRRIGEESGRSEDAVKMLIGRLKQRLRDCVDRRGGLGATSPRETGRGDRR